MRLVFFLLVLIFCICTGAPTTEAKILGCYERTYDKVHLKKHPKQRIKFISLQYGLQKDLNGPENLLDQITAKVTGINGTTQNLIVCKLIGSVLDCGIEADGGLFTATETAKGIKITNASEMTFGDDEVGVSLKAEGEHQVFLLNKKSNGPCKQ